ncbi:MAG TPA: Ig-like domain-containing protein [Chloroflexota bacterium]|nr:Ig-like domain-containing protein [Chloroflexota bacterium]
MTFSRFDVTVWAVMALLAGLVAAVIFMGSRVGLAVVGQTPAPNAAHVSTQTQIRVQFEDVLDSAPDTAVTLSPFISGTTTLDGNTLIFQPAVPLAADTTYAVTIQPGVQGENGRTLHEPLTWQFQTGQPRILFIKPDPEGPDQIYVADADGRLPPTQLSRTNASVLDFAVAPDSSQIVFAVMTHDQGTTGTADLWLMNADGSNQRMLLACPEATCSRPVWTPDGRRLVYERREILNPGAPPGNPRLWWLDIGSGQTAPVFQDSQLLGLFAAISPDGRWLSYVSPTDQGIQLYNLENGTGLLVPNKMGTAVAWHPGSEQIALADIVTSDTDWGVVISTVAIPGGDVTTLSQSENGGLDVDDSSPAWSPDGERIAFGRKQARSAMGRQLWLMDADGTAVLPLSGDPDIHHSAFYWSPDGRSLLYQRYNLKELYAQPGVWVIDIQTGQTTEIAYPATQPAWLP